MKALIVELNKCLEVDTYNRSRKAVFSRARQGVFFTLKKKGFSCKEIGEVFKYSRQGVEKGVYHFEYMLAVGEKHAVKYAERLRPFWHD